jgi:hypothetical protein
MWIVSLAASTAVAGAAHPARAAAENPVAVWDMNEAAGSPTMLDSGGRHLNGTIGGEVGVGTDVDGARGYRFARLDPDTPPTHPRHLVTVPAAARLDPGTGDFAVTVRLRTTYQFGNVVQKGQSTVPGGNWKIQIPSGHPQCVFRGTNGTMLASAPGAVNDGRWHVVTCLRDAAGLWLSIDGTRVAGHPGHTGRIANTWPLSIGGKPSCDQVEVGCDYYAGDIDYVRIDSGEPGQAIGGGSGGSGGTAGNFGGGTGLLPDGGTGWGSDAGTVLNGDGSDWNPADWDDWDPDRPAWNASSSGGPGW